ncbi:hypothetical protein C8R44DRAFT_895108 [Mycena epipterygia]|nr:hypothetical protein C8R44DRAFT_895108 [Mycena epipterygia]
MFSLIVDAHWKLRSVFSVTVHSPSHTDARAWEVGDVVTSNRDAFIITLLLLYVSSGDSLYFHLTIIFLQFYLRSNAFIIILLILYVSACDSLQFYWTINICGFTCWRVTPVRRQPIVLSLVHTIMLRT